MKKPLFTPLLSTVFLLLASIASAQTNIQVSSEIELQTAINSATAGNIIIINNGTYTDVNLTLECIGSTEKPIIIKAENAGKVTFQGNFNWLNKGEHVTIEGLRFSHVKRSTDSDLIRDVGQYNTYANCEFHHINDVNGTYIKLEGQHSKVDHCEFVGKTTRASYINTDIPEQGGAHHIISHNYFSRPPLGQNGGSAMRIGHGSMALYHAYITIQENLFENCDGEEEIVSIKSSSNHIKNNTFRMCKGAFSLRQGRGNSFEGNIFIGNGTKRCGGLTIRGRDHQIFNNYFGNLNPKKEGVINFGVASPEDPERIKLGMYPRHFPLTQDILLYHNTIINNKGKSHINYLEGYGTRDRFDLPQNIQFYNNVFGKAKQFEVSKSGVGVEYTSNFYEGNATINGILSCTLKTKMKDELLVPTKENRFINLSTPQAIDKDILEQQRDNKPDAGCFEYQNQTKNSRKPLRKNDVGCMFK